MVRGPSLDSHWHLHHPLGLTLGFTLWAVVGKTPREDLVKMLEAGGRDPSGWVGVLGF
jgi:hypothetical protein